MSGSAQPQWLWGPGNHLLQTNFFSRSEGYSKQLIYKRYTDEHSACSWDFRVGLWVELLCH